ncbi:MAG: hypothetical protein IJR99_08910 [Kiritimatiellae bacterium]|nr:hypothetical protein [Kiritimatiellia bacterium]
MSMQVTNNAAVNWGQLLSEVNRASGGESAQAVTNDNRAVTFTMEVNGAATTVTFNVPDDLELPSTVDLPAIDTLVSKLSGDSFNLSQDQIAAFKTTVTATYNKMAGTLGQVQSASTKSVMFDLYQLMALLVEVAQSQRDAAREMRSTENQMLQSAIQSQADAQRDAAMVGLIVGVTCGAVSALVSAGTMVGQMAATHSQNAAINNSGVKAAQNNVAMVKNADTLQHANAQLTSVTNEVGGDVSQSVRTRIDQQVQVQKDAFTGARTEVGNKQTALTDAQTARTDAIATAADAQTAVDQAQTAFTQAKSQVLSEGIQLPPDEVQPVAIGEGENAAAQARDAYVNNCGAAGKEPNQAILDKYGQAIDAETALDHAKTSKTEADTAVADAEKGVTDAETDLSKAQGKLEDARVNYRAALKTAAEGYETTYESALSREAPKAEVDGAQKDMKMARAYVNRELAQDGVTTSVEHRRDVAAAKFNADEVAKDLNLNADYQKATRRMEVLSGVNSINVAIGNMLQSMSQSISSMMGAEATRMGAEQEAEKEALDQTKDLFSQAQNVVDAAIQLLNAIGAAESQSMRDAIQA